MKSAAFRYEKPSSIEEALALKAEYGDEARYLAGGQSLLPALNMRLDYPSLLIDLNGLTELEGITLDGETVRVGALARTKAVGESDVVARHLPMLARCVEHIAHPAIRTRGTFGGSVALADPAAEWPACCLALGATIVLRSVRGERSIEASEFFQGLYTTAMERDELLVHVQFPVSPHGVRAVALELSRRRGDYAIVGLVAQACADGGDLSDVATAFFGLSDRPIRLREVEDALGRGALDAAHAAIDSSLPAEGDLYHLPATKRHLAKVLVSRAAAQLVH